MVLTARPMPRTYRLTFCISKASLLKLRNIASCHERGNSVHTLQVWLIAPDVDDAQAGRNGAFARSRAA